MKKIPPGTEACNVLVGELDFLKKPIIAFVRLENALLLGDLTEVPIQTRFLFFMLGPSGTPGRYHEVGRGIATMMADEVCMQSGPEIYLFVKVPAVRLQRYIFP